MIKNTKKKAKAKVKTKSIQALRKEADRLASEVVRLRDKRCLMCGATENLQAHHFIVTKGASTKHRWNLKNLVSLCYCCHIHKVHSTASLKWVGLLKKSALLNGICTEQDIEEISNDIEPMKINKGVLEGIIAGLKAKKEQIING
jgi:predicted restriction endonuclease